MTAPAPLTPSSPDWGSIVCDYCHQAPVTVAGYVCWNCQSYVEYLESRPGCDCPHEVSYDCACSADCEEDCPAAYAAARSYWDALGDGESASQPREAPERSEGEG